jgi:hypothetical protein
MHLQLHFQKQLPSDGVGMAQLVCLWYALDEPGFEAGARNFSFL